MLVEHFLTSGPLCVRTFRFWWLTGYPVDAPDGRGDTLLMVACADALSFAARRWLTR